ncbi:ribosome-associated translation inhibitor RaiA [Pelistega sp. NLN82]|uniref:Ribosome hibernation promoting factor n=1 Tax=Pelistega ratti TaxID=2652177 RepID=A0A6L9Y3E3_9BURK|nr:ribosome-associated translation inhibitor RaiA [Pelistega ratti]NEN74891.1 ribosome-associated translation inhibitor RaiA [Pelistega ratti]
MNLHISGHHLDITPAINDYVQKKLDRVLRHIDNIIDIQVILSKEPLKQKAEMTLRVPGKDIHAESIDDNLYAAIDLLIDKIDRLVVKHKEKQKKFV